MASPAIRHLDNDSARSLDELLRSAIASRYLLELGYKGTVRTVEPHDYGVQAGVTRLFVYQLREHGGPAEKRGWRLLDVAKIEQCRETETAFAGSRGEQDQRHMQWDVLYARVE